jgi:hypothetical protein
LAGGSVRAMSYSKSMFSRGEKVRVLEMEPTSALKDAVIVEKDANLSFRYKVSLTDVGSDRWVDSYQLIPAEGPLD